MRRSRSILLWTAAAAFLAAPVASASTSRDDKGSQLVCKSKPKTGTRFKTKTCHSRADWDKITEQNRREAEELINRRMIDVRRGN